MPEELDEPAAAAALARRRRCRAGVLDPEPLEELEWLEALVVPLPDTVSPT